MQRHPLRMDFQLGFGRCAMASYISPSTRPGAIAKFLTEIGREIFGSYRPEKHYMRGEGAIPSPRAGAERDHARDAHQDLR